jgi:7,8-dihydropterin-6-yl-methyl-4-(beta-D-ribofuranosyl)aminobenzene 5'-phosphate synthase
MKIITVVENLVYRSGLAGEHGLSFYIEDGKQKLLFDLGQSDMFLRNANILGIDIARIDQVVFSHGHYDHTGGLPSFMKKNKRAIFHVKKEARTPKFDHTGKRFIGMPSTRIPRERLAPNNEADICKLSEHIWLFRKIPIHNAWDTHFEGLRVVKDNRLQKDHFEDEQFIVIRKPREMIILSGCSHRGITNIILAAKKHFDLPVALVLAGIHLKGIRSKQTFRKYAAFFLKNKVKKLRLCHCTGVEEYASLKNLVKGNIFYNHTGMIHEE